MDTELGRVAARQHGVFSRAQAVAAGATDAQIRHRLAVERWLRIGPGVYRVAGAPSTWHQRALAACLVSGPATVVSHRSAAVVWAVSGFRPGPIEITVPHGRSVRNALARVHRSSDVRGVVRDAIPVTRPARMLSDLASVVSEARLEEAVDDVLCRRLCRLEEITVTPGRRGSAALSEVLQAWIPGTPPVGVAEMRAERQLLAAGLPRPVRQYEIRSGGKFVARVDWAYPWARLAMELDGFRWHAEGAPFAATGSGGTGSRRRGGGCWRRRPRTCRRCAGRRRRYSGRRPEGGHYARRRVRSHRSRRQPLQAAGFRVLIE